MNRDEFKVVFLEKVMDELGRVGNEIYRTLFQMFGPIFSIVATAATLAASYVHIFATIPYYFGYRQEWGFEVYFYLIFSCWVIYNIFYNYLMVLLTNPGYIPRRSKAIGESEQYEEAENYCKKCKYELDIYMGRKKKR